MGESTHPTTERARELRQRANPAEQALWAVLKARKLGGYKFTRQMPIGPYFADFACREGKFIVEVDGASHSSAAECEYDAARSAFLELQGFRVMRVWNLEVFENLDGVLETILLTLERDG